MSTGPDEQTHSLTPDSRPGSKEAEQAWEQLESGTQVAEYLVQAPIATGGCGTVYSAKHRALARKAAVKVLRRDLASSPAMVKRFLLEAQAVNQIEHPNIVDIFDCGILPDSRPFLLMEFLDGETASTAVKRHGRLSPSRVLEILEPVCAALDAAHKAGVIHRDLKASNIMIARKGDREVVKLLDFGIAKLMQPEPGQALQTAAGIRLGTPYAMSPEQIRAEPVDPRTDVYGLGVLAFFLLTAQVPFSGDWVEVEQKHLTTSPPLPSRLAPVSSAIDAVILRALEKEPDRRHESAKAFLEAFRHAVQATAEKAAADAGKAELTAAVCVALKGPAEMDDVALADMAQALDLAEQVLRDVGLTVPLQTANLIVGVRALDADPARQQEGRAELAGLARTLHKAIAERADPDPRVRVNVCVHADVGMVRADASVTEVVGGPILDVESWAPRDTMVGPCATPEAAAGLERCAPADGYGRYLAIG